MEVRPLKENNRTARISFKPNTKNSLSICECLKSQLTEAFKYMDVVAAVQSKILPRFERFKLDTTTYELDMIVSFKYDFLRKDEVPQEKKQEVQDNLNLNLSNYSSNDPKFWMYSSGNEDAWKFNKVNMLFKHARKLFTAGDDRTNTVHVKDWVIADEVTHKPGGSSVLINIQVPYYYSRNLGTMNSREINKHNKTIRSLSYKLRMMLKIMDVVEMYDETEDNGSMLYSSRILIKLKNPNTYKPVVKEPKVEKVDNLSEEREYLNARLIEVEKQIEEHTKVLKDLTAKANGLRNAIEVLK